ncbi:hypothetical protein M405DRAFT_207623 [Rhizopogon salebrosus TDB-379]|nr:hypothetical protein M405DRAFT_207623 [Rhizopogon salebrosus TDB-379]
MNSPPLLCLITHVPCDGHPPHTTFLMFKRATENTRKSFPVHAGTTWVNSPNRLGSPADIAAYCMPPDGERESHWAPVGVAFIVAYFTPTTKIGCRSMSYLAYGALIWMLLLTSRTRALCCSLFWSNV